MRILIFGTNAFHVSLILISLNHIRVFFKWTIIEAALSYEDLNHALCMSEYRSSLLSLFM